VDERESASGAVPVEPAPTALAFAAVPDEHGRVAVGGDLEPGTVLAAYRAGAFPMRQKDGALAWWSPDPRAVLTVDRFRVTRSLRRSLGRFTVTVDAAFERVVDACADRGADEYLWITAEVRDAYVRLHALGWAHSVEAWTVPDAGDEPELAGGLYGVAVGGLFSGESMFSRRPDASKVALTALVDLLGDDGRGGADRLVDVQWLTPHLASLGAVELPRAEYLDRLGTALALSLPKAFTAGR
jgi:leucyl/phenylalanyl-tRNA---protein transferase